MGLKVSPETNRDGDRGAARAAHDWHEQYDLAGHADYYAQKHDATLGRRMSNLLERDMVRRAIRRLADCHPIHSMLDIPSGTGRFVSVVAEFAQAVIAMDLSASMLSQMRTTEPSATSIGACVASALALPLPDRSVDAVLCARLIHHLPVAAPRVALLAELARVARFGVVVTFFDARSLRGVRRQSRHQRIPKRNTRFAMTRGQMVAEAAEAGLHPVGLNALFRLHTEATAAVFVRSNTAARRGL